MRPGISRRWIELFLLMCAFSTQAVVHASDPNLVDYKPQWTVGQTWRVSVEYPGWGFAMTSNGPAKKLVSSFLYEVEALVEIEGQSCYRIRIDPRYIRYQSGRFFKVFCRASDGIPVLVEMYGTRLITESDRSEPDGELQISQVFYRGPVDASSSKFTGPPLAFPVFSADVNKHASLVSSMSESILRSGAEEPNAYCQEHHLSDVPWSVNGKETQVLNIDLSPSQLSPEDASKELLRQTWAKGLPWWLSAEQKGRPSWDRKRRLGAKSPYIAKLTHVDGKPILAGPDTLTLTIEPVPAASKASLEDLQSRAHVTIYRDWFAWCPSVIRAEDGTFHMFHSRWPKSIGFLSWLSHSEIVHAVAECPEGPYREIEVVMPPTGPGRGDWFTAHNSKIKRFGDRYYLYFIQTRGDSFAVDGPAKRLDMAKTGYRHPLWMKEARPNQRTFVAISDSLDGPWEVSPEPIIQPAKTITTLTVNPAVCRGPDGTYFMIIKGDKPKATGFVRNQALATAPAPEGPWTIRDKPVIDDLDTEDASMWYDQTRERFYAVFHARGFIGLMTSADGYNWAKANQYRLTPKEIPFDDGSVWKPDRMERPFVLTDEKGRPQILFVACRKGDLSANIALFLSTPD